MQNRRIRTIALYGILAICALSVLGSLVTGKAPPEAVYGLLGTFGGYLLLGPGDRKSDDDDDDDDHPRQLAAPPPPAPADRETPP